MKRTAALLAVVAVPLAAATAGFAQKPPKPPGQQAVTIKASAEPTVFSVPLTVDGSVKGAKAGVTVVLQGREATATEFSEIATTSTDQQGDYAFITRPEVNTVYRAVASTAPPVQSADLLVRVRPLVGFRVSDSTPSRGERVRFRGTVRPPHDGRRVSIQRRRADGSFTTVARTRLRDAGDEFSRYSRRVRVRRTAVYRVRILGHEDHAMGVSRERTLTVG